MADCSALISSGTDPEEVATLLMNRAYCYGRTENYGQAIQDYGAALRSSASNDVHCLFNRGICYEKLGEYLKVRSIVEKMTG